MVTTKKDKKLIYKLIRFIKRLFKQFFKKKVKRNIDTIALCLRHCQDTWLTLIGFKMVIEVAHDNETGPTK